MTRHKFTNQPSFMIDAAGFVMAGLHLSNAELGESFKKLCESVLAKDFAAARSYRYVGRIFKGTAKRPHIPMPLRRKILAVGKCVKCAGTHKLQVDHIFPFSLGGGNDESNLQCLCRKCNRSKGVKV